MPFRSNAISKVVGTDGRPYTIFIVDNPTIEDVVVVEAKVYAAEVMNNSTPPDRRVSRDIRDILIRLGVER